MERVKEVLTIKERSWAWLSRKIGVSETLMSLWRKGERRVVEVHQLKMAEVLGVPVDFLFPDGVPMLEPNTQKADPEAVNV